MKSIKATLLALCSASFMGLASCGPDDNPEPKIYPPDLRIVNTLLFEEGAWWAFEDSTTLKKDTFILSQVFYGLQNAYEGNKLVYTSFEYEAKLRQTSTNRKFSIQYSSRDNANYRNVYTPMAILKAYRVVFPPNSTTADGYQNILFNTNLGDTITSGFAIVQVQHVSSRFLLQDKGVGIAILGKNYNEPYYKMLFINSVAYDKKELRLILIENIGFGHHNIEGNFYLIDHNAQNIEPK